MPQLMPLCWCLSILMVLVLVVMGFKLFYENEEVLKAEKGWMGVGKEWEW